MAWFFERDKFLSKEAISGLLKRAAHEAADRLCGGVFPKRVLLLPPDITRAHSGAGWMTELLYTMFTEHGEVYVMPTLGQHQAHSPQQNKAMFGSIPESRILKHDWLHDTLRIGELSKDYVQAVCGVDWSMSISVNKILFENWDLIINVGHVVPHEVLGFANHNKNIFIGLGGKDIIASSHMAAACNGIENNLGCLVTPVRHCFNKAETEYLSELPMLYIMLVMKYDENGALKHSGLYCGTDCDTYLLAAEQSKRDNITVVPPLKKVVAVMQGDEFFSTWVSNKAVYRTRKAMADGGELIIIAPGLKRFGETEAVDAIIRTYGYAGTPAIMEAWRSTPLLQDMSHATAHLLNGSSEGRFTVTYAPGHVSRAEIEQVKFAYMDYNEAIAKYNPHTLHNGFNTMPDGEEIYFISTPSAGLWTTKEKLA